MKKRKGFTLIELMIVIAIIIILAAIAIPNYLRMTDRARRSRVAGDFTSIATALEAYSVDWGTYPIMTTVGTPEAIGKNVHATADSHIMLELEGTGTAAPEVNIPTDTTLTGEAGGINYIKSETLWAIYNPFNPTDDYWYASNASGTHWVLAAQYNTTDVLWRSDGTTDLTQATGVVANLAIIDDGTVTP
jgi:prepilin-type N-terminal cleavage/methylation domain-containing protein